jgi:hypothetical protein
MSTHELKMLQRRFEWNGRRTGWASSGLKIATAWFVKSK